MLTRKSEINLYILYIYRHHVVCICTEYLNPFIQIPDETLPRSPVVIHSATNVIQDSLVYLNQPEKDEPSLGSREGSII